MPSGKRPPRNSPGQLPHGKFPRKNSLWEIVTPPSGKLPHGKIDLLVLSVVDFFLTLTLPIPDEEKKLT